MGSVVYDVLARTVPEWVPAVVASRVENDLAWTVFEPIDGHPLEEWESKESGPRAVAIGETDDFLGSIRGQVSRAAHDLARSGWPNTIDHVDLNVSNALVTARRVTIIDWEEAVVGFPACSLDRLIDDANGVR